MWLMHQVILKEIIKQNGGNNCSIPHLLKEILERARKLPMVLYIMEKVSKFEPWCFEEQNSPAHNTNAYLTNKYKPINGFI